MLEIMSAAGGYGQSVTGGYITISSNATTNLPNPNDGSTNGTWPAGASMSGNLGTYAPGSFLSDAGGTTPSKDAYPGLAALSSSTMPSVNGTGTFSSVFNGAQANGAWSLYLIDYDGPVCTASFSSWSLSFASTATSNATTSTTVSGGTHVFCNAGTIAGTSQTNMSPFPSVVTASGVSNAVQDVTVQLKNYSFADEGRDAQLMLMAPNGSSAMVLMSDLNFGSASTVTNTNSFTFTDSGLQVTGSNPFAGNGALTYAPTSLYVEPGAFIQTLPTTPPSGEPTVHETAASGTYSGIGVPATVGTATLFSTFNGVAANGTWSLFALTGNQPMSIGGWCLGITPAIGAATTTAVSGSPNPAITGAAVAITATVNSASATPTGTVSLKDGLTDATISGCGSVPLVASGTDSAKATCNVSTLAEGDHTITATYSGDTGFNQSIGSYDQRINDSVSASLTGGVLTYCNTGAIKIPDPNSVGGGAGYPNPSNITVAGLFGTVNTVSVALKNFNDLYPQYLTSLLVGPGGNLDFFSGAGGTTANSTIASLLFQDSASGQVPASLGNGPYKPTSDPDSGSFPPLVFTSSPFYTVPGALHSAASNGSSTFALVFGGTAPNGNWDLYFYNQDSSLASAGYGLGGGWCLNLTPHVPTFTITETHEPASFVPGGTGQITLNVNNTSIAAVTSGGSAYPVTITDVLPNGLTYASISSPAGDWSCSGTSTVTCTNADVVAGGDSYGTLVLNLNVSNTATGGNNPTQVSEGPPGSFGSPTGLSAADNIPVASPPVLSVVEGNTGTFTQGVTGGTLTVTVSNTGPATSSTGGTTTVTETLPNGYTSSSISGISWSCSGTSSITCTSTQAVAGGADFFPINIVVNVPSDASNSTVTNAATASGGGASASVNSGTVSFPVVQVPTSMTTVISSQSAAINTAFGTVLSVTVKDAGGNPVSGVNVTFTAPSSGASGLFSNTTNVIVVTTNSVGVASAGLFTANTAAGGYNVAATVTGLAPVNFSLTNILVAATHFSVSAPASATSGQSFSFTVTALDAANNTATGYNGTVHFASSDGAAVLPSNSTLTAGSKTFSATLATAGNRTITATDTVSSSVTGASGLINVLPACTQVTAFTVFASGPVYNRGTKLFYETVTITNTGGAAIQGPIELVFNGLPGGLTLVNSTGTAPNGSPYLTLASSLASRASASVTAQFSNPSNVPIPISITLFSGVF